MVFWPRCRARSTPRAESRCGRRFLPTLRVPRGCPFETDELGRSWPYDLRAESERHLRELLTRAEIGTRVRLDPLASIVRDGRFKTVHEGAPSRNPTRSIDEEAEVWVLDQGRLAEFPIFGYAASVDDVSEPATRASLHSAYGSARVLLADEVRERTSVFFGDSLSWIRGRTGAPAPLDTPDELAWPLDRGSPMDRATLDEGAADEFVEVQIIGGIAIGAIKRVLFDYEPPAAVAELLDQREIHWTVNAMPALPRYLEQVFQRDTLQP